jgi:ribonuclease E
MALALLREIEEEGVRQRSKEVLILAPVEIANYLLNQKREHIAMIETRFGLSVRVEGDAALVSPDYRVERFKTASRVIPTPEGPLLPPVAYPEEEPEEAVREEVEAEAAADGAQPEKGGGKRKRRRRRRGGGKPGAEAAPAEAAGAPEAAEAAAADAGEATPEAAQPAAEEAAPERGKSRRRSRGGAARAARAPEPEAPGTEPFPEAIDVTEDAGPDIVEVPEADAPQRRTRERVRRPAAAVLSDAGAPEAAAPDAQPEEPAEPAPDAAPEPAEAAGAEAPERDEAASGSKRRGWWSRALGGS